MVSEFVNYYISLIFIEEDTFILLLWKMLYNRTLQQQRPRY